jgi:predicted nucleic acid-binding protein
MNDFKYLYGKTVFVDSNAIIYHLQGLSEITKEIFKLGEIEKLKLVSTTRVVDEVIHKILLIRAKDKFNIESKTIKKLRKDKEKVKELSEDIKIIKQFLDVIKLHVIETTYKDLQKISDIMKNYGLFGNDALILITMNKYNLKYLLSSDTDFKNIDWISLIEIKDFIL